ncbi:SDR family NAD(P)-dependent oxidoreductase [Nocardia abscessus]|uniref:SDR family NAD(P)-dependent oxidoreductase n=1 Tax=Nocardia abscessus TaxID=120957 RepID=UPI0024590770|nr:SDR family oxidoreductase [Nocardia abscessus]
MNAGKKAVVTGGTHGIGLAIVEALLAEGMEVVLTGRNEHTSIVFTTVANDVVFPGLSAYSGSKEALRAIAQVLAAELLPRRIRVNSVAPGFIETPTMGVVGLTEQQRAEFLEPGERSTPLRRNGTVHEVAKAALFLAFDATFTTGVELPVDGGWAQGLGADAEAAA